MRYVEPTDLDTIVPPTIHDNVVAESIYNSTFSKCREAYAQLRAHGIPKEDARFIIPMGIETQIIITGNFRTWLHFLNLRTSRAAQWEIRDLAWKCYDILAEHAPHVFDKKYQKLWVFV